MPYSITVKDTNTNQILGTADVRDPGSGQLTWKWLTGQFFTELDTGGYFTRSVLHGIGPNGWLVAFPDRDIEEVGVRQFPMILTTVSGLSVGTIYGTLRWGGIGQPAINVVLEITSS